MEIHFKLKNIYTHLANNSIIVGFYTCECSLKQHNSNYNTKLLLLDIADGLF